MRNLPPRVAVFLPSFGWRGANRVMLNLANALSARALPVDLVLATGRGEPHDRLSSAVRVIDLDARGVLGAVPRFVRYLRRWQPRVVLSAMDYVNVLSVLACAVSGRESRAFVTCHTSLRESIRHSPWWRDRLLPLAVRLAYPRARGVIAVSSGVADVVADVARIPRDRVHVIHNPAVLPSLAEDAAVPVAHPWFRPGSSPVILGVGSLTPAKDFGTLLRAFALLRRTCECRLVVLGEGEDRGSLDELAAHLGVTADVSMPGFVSNPYSYMARAAVVAVSSRWEGFALVVAEALACGTPVVSTDCPSGPAEILQGGRYGTLVPVADAEALATAILDSLRRGHDRERLKARGNEFSLAAAVDQYVAVCGLDGNG